MLFIAWLHCALVEGLSTTPVGLCQGAGVAGFFGVFIRAFRTRCENEQGMNECEIMVTKHTAGVKCATGKCVLCRTPPTRMVVCGVAFEFLNRTLYAIFYNRTDNHNLKNGIESCMTSFEGKDFE